MKTPLLLTLLIIIIVAGLKAEPSSNLSNPKSYIIPVNDTLQLTALMDTIKLYVKRSDYDRVVSYSKKMLSLSHKLSDSSHMVTSNHYLGYYLQVQLKSAEAYKYYNEAFKLNVHLKDYSAAATMLNSMANIQKGLGDYIGSQITSVEGLDYVMGTKNYQMESALYHNISVCSKELGDYPDAILWNRKAIQLSLEHPGEITKSTLSIYQNTRANILVKYHKYQEAIALYLELLNENDDHINNKERARILDNLAFTKWLSGDKDPALETLLLDNLQLRIQINDIPGLISNYIHLTQFYSETDKAQALLYAEKAYTATLERQNPISSMEALDYIIRLKHELGKNATAQALAYSEIRNDLEQSNQKIRRIYAATKYDNDQLSKDVLLLKTATAEKEKQNILYLSSFIIVLMGSSFLFVILKRKHRLEKIQESYITETRISKKVHDELANDVYQLMIQLETDENNTHILDTMEQIYDRTRDISRENNSIHTGERYAKELRNMLGGYTPTSAKIYVQGMEVINWEQIAHEKKVALYRILQELMTNMKKHSEATLIAISFKKSGKFILVSYSDNGKGTTKTDQNLGNGLHNVENRISAIQGSFTFTSQIGNGFKAELKFPK